MKTLSKSAASCSIAPRRKRMRWLVMLNLIVLVGIGLWFLFGALTSVGGGKPDGVLAKMEKSRVYASISAEDEAGFERIDPNDPGGWLTVFKETPQSLDTYRRLHPIRPTSTRRTIVLQPLGPMNAEQTKIVATLREYTEIFFQLPARVEKPLSLLEAQQWTRPVSAGRALRDQQYDADEILHRVLRPRLPDDAVAYLGITMVDLWSGDLNYVFGLGSFRQRVGVYSLCRYFPEFWARTRQIGDETKALKRACKVLNHETGHMFGLSHCVFYKCSMNGSNSLQESDSRPMEYCPICHRKLLWNIGFDANKRYQELRSFFQKHGMKDEAEWLTERIKRWKRVAAVS